MKFENLIWIIIPLIYVVSVILKRARADSKAGEKGIVKKPPGWKEKLNQFLSQMKQEIEATKQEGLNQETGWEEILPQEDDDLEPVRKEISPERTEQVLEITPSPKIKPARVKAVAESIEQGVSGKAISHRDLAYGVQDLRKAVIWSEILAPPLALRDE